MAASALKVTDPELAELIVQEANRQAESLELIASENFTSPEVLECLGSILTNKYSEGYPGRRYYGGNEIIDKIETLAQQRALAAFRLDSAQWQVNVQPYSGSTANAAVYLALLQPHDRIMGLDLPSGGHLTHGFYTAKRKVSSTSIYYESIPYQVDSTATIDYDALERMALIVKPKLIIAGYSAYVRDLDYARFRAIANKVGAYLMCDMAHFSGFVAAGLLGNPFDYCDVVTTTTHKTLRGPRAGMIFSKTALAQRINDAVFPGLQGGPHEHQIAAIATQMREVAMPAFRDYMMRVGTNAKRLAQELVGMGLEVVTGTTENHIILLNVKPLTGAKAEYALEQANISVNKNTLFGDQSALNPSGIRIGTPAITTRGMDESDMYWVAAIIYRTLKVAAKYSDLPMEEFKAAIGTDSVIPLLKAEVALMMRSQTSELLS